MSSYECQLSMWPVQRGQRLELDDALGVPREVEHFAYFTRRRDADSAAVELSEEGLTVDLSRRRLKTVLRATREESLEDDQVARFLRDVISIVEGHRGDYDGWGATVEVRSPT